MPQSDALAAAATQPSATTVDPDIQNAYATARAAGLIDSDPELHGYFTTAVKAGLAHDLSSPGVLHASGNAVPANHTWSHDDIGGQASSAPASAAGYKPVIVSGTPAPKQQPPVRQTAQLPKRFQQPPSGKPKEVGTPTVIQRMATGVKNFFKPVADYVTNDNPLAVASRHVGYMAAGEPSDQAQADAEGPEASGQSPVQKALQNALPIVGKGVADFASAAGENQAHQDVVRPQIDAHNAQITRLEGIAFGGAGHENAPQAMRDAAMQKIREHVNAIVSLGDPASGNARYAAILEQHPELHGHFGIPTADQWQQQSVSDAAKAAGNAAIDHPIETALGVGGAVAGGAGLAADVAEAGGAARSAAALRGVARAGEAVGTLGLSEAGRASGAILRARQAAEAARAADETLGERAAAESAVSQTYKGVPRVKRGAPKASIPEPPAAEPSVSPGGTSEATGDTPNVRSGAVPPLANGTPDVPTEVPSRQAVIEYTPGGTVRVRVPDTTLPQSQPGSLPTVPDTQSGVMTPTNVPGRVSPVRTITGRKIMPDIAQRDTGPRIQVTGTRGNAPPPFFLSLENGERVPVGVPSGHADQATLGATQDTRIPQVLEQVPIARRTPESVGAPVVDAPPAVSEGANLARQPKATSKTPTPVRSAQPGRTLADDEIPADEEPTSAVKKNEGQDDQGARGIGGVDEQTQALIDNARQNVAEGVKAFPRPKQGQFGPTTATGAGASPKPGVATRIGTALRSDDFAEDWAATKAQVRNWVVGRASRLLASDPESYAAYRKLVSSEAQAEAALRTTLPKIGQSYTGDAKGFGPAAKDAIDRHLTVLAESRLMGTRNMWNDLSNTAAAHPDEIYNNWSDYRRLIDADAKRSSIPDVVKSADGIKDKADAAYAAGDTAAGDAYRDHLANLAELAFQDSRDRVAFTTLKPGSFNTIVTTPEFTAAQAAYKNGIEAPLKASHVANGGVVSGNLGPLDTYVPLVATDGTAGTGDRIGSMGGGAGKSAPYKNPGNINNRFTTGTAPGYETGVNALRDSMVRAIRNNNRANLIDSLEKSGALVKIPHGGFVPETMTWQGRDVPAMKVITKEARTMVSGGKAFTTPPEVAIIPKALHSELGDVLDSNWHPNEGHSFVTRLGDAVNAAALSGPTEAMWHSQNILHTIVNNTPYIHGNLHPVLRAIEGAYGLKTASAMTALAKMDLTTPAAMEDLRWLADHGSLSGHWGQSTSSADYAAMMGVKQKRGFGTLISGPSGIDARARVLMLRIGRSINPAASDADLTRFVDQIPNYNPMIQSKAEGLAKSSRLGPFVTAGMTMNRNAVLGTVGMSPLPTKGMPMGQRLLLRLQQLGSGPAAPVIAGAVLHYAITGKNPMQDPKYRIGMVPIPDELRRSAEGKVIFGPGSDTQYVDLGLANSMPERAGRVTGVMPAAQALLNGATPGEALEKGAVSAANSALHPITSGPVAQSGSIALSGNAPHLVGRDTMTGKNSLGFLPVAPERKPGMPQAIANAEEAALTVNPVAHAAATIAGIGGEGERENKAKVPTVTRLAKQAITTVMPRFMPGFQPDNAKDKKGFARVTKRTSKM